MSKKAEKPAQAGDLFYTCSNTLNIKPRRPPRQWFFPSFSSFFPFLSLQVIYQTREAVFHRDIQTPRRELKIRRARMRQCPNRLTYLLNRNKN